MIPTSNSTTADNLTTSATAAPQCLAARILDALPSVRIGVIGDICLDVYWEMDPAAAESSLETGLLTRPVAAQRHELGGAANVANNLVAMGVGTVKAFGVLGDDPYGREILRQMEARGIDPGGLCVQRGDWDTHTFHKPLADGNEENRIDLGNYNRLHDEVAADLLARLEAALPALDVVIINQQVRSGIHSESFQGMLGGLLARHPGMVFLADCRQVAGAYPGCVRKLTEAEALRLAGDAGAAVSLGTARDAARRLFEASRRPVIVSCGERGALVTDGGGLHVVPGLHLLNPTDPVGAGDSMVAGVAAALAAGRGVVEAAVFGGFVAGVTAQKLKRTGTATPAEILAIGADPDHVYAPDLAVNPRRARYHQDTDIEIVEDLPGPLRVTHAIFDHDGTISTLREGWEAVMEPVMMRAVLGDRHATADDALYRRVEQRVREFIDKTTGVQTIAQMQGLVRIVREFGLVPESEVRDEFQYKAIYLEALMEVVNVRLAKLRRSELDLADFSVKSAPCFLRRLRAAGVKLYLASGTDEKDVVAEAKALGYADLFEGRIYGAVQDVTVEAKRMVLERILKDIGRENVTRVVTFGDGPVELRETRKRGGIAVGIASDEVRRHGLTPAKRTRLIRAGAHLVAPDFSQMNQLLGLLGLS